jgi:hypothetical protein
VDWNNDGKKDLITGENNGNIRVYLNTGTDDNPSFSGHFTIQKGGSVFDCGNYSMPHIVDWNSDGRKDVLCGESTGKIWLLLNRGTDADPVFVDAVYVKAGAADLDAGDRVSPTTVDWNCDGKKDLLVGEMNGRVLYYENIGTDDEPDFNNTLNYLQAGGKQLDVHYYARIDVTDWDEDGVMDLLSGNRYYDGTPTGGIWFFHAKGPLLLSENAVSAATGGTITLTLDAGVANGSRNYYVLGSTSGTDPGTVMPGGVVLPLNWDWFTDLALTLVNTSIFDQFSGMLNAAGEAEAKLNVPGSLPPEVIGVIMSYAYTMPSPFDYASNGANIEFVP